MFDPQLQKVDTPADTGRFRTDQTPVFTDHYTG